MSWGQPPYGSTNPYANQYATTGFQSQAQPGWPPAAAAYNTNPPTGANAWPPGYNPPASSAWPPGYQPPNATNYNSATYTPQNSYISSNTSTMPPTTAAQQYDPSWPPGMGPNANFPVPPSNVTPVSSAPIASAAPSWPPQHNAYSPAAAVGAPVTTTITPNPTFPTQPTYTGTWSQTTTTPMAPVSTTMMTQPTTMVQSPMYSVSTAPTMFPSQVPMQSVPVAMGPTSLAPIGTPTLERKMSKVQEALLQQMAEEEARRQAAEEAALKDREAQIQRAKTMINLAAPTSPAAPASPHPGGSAPAVAPLIKISEEPDVNDLVAQNAARRRELERRRSALLEEEQMLEAMRRSAEEEKLRREAIRRKQEADAALLLQEQQELQRRERELAERKRAAEESKKQLDQVVQDALTTEAKFLQAQHERERQHKDLERQRQEEEARKREQQELQQSFYGSLVDASKLIAQNSNRLYSLIETQYSDIMQKDSAPAQFFADVQRLLDRTTQRLLSLLDDNVLNLENQLYNSISNASRDVRTSAQSLLAAAQKLTSGAPEVANLSEEERSKQIRHHNVALNFSIKTFLQELEAMKVAENSSSDSLGLLQAQTMKESAVLVDRQLEVQSAKVDPKDLLMQQQAELKKKQTMARFRPSTPVRMTPAQLARYDVPAVRKLQRAIRQFALRSKMRNLAIEVANSPTSQHNRHRNKLLREIVDSEASYVQSIQNALQFFLPAIQAAAANPAGFVKPTDVQQLFSTLDLIYDFNSKLLEKMRARLKLWPANQLFGDILVEASANMEIYCDYVNNFDVANDVYKRLYQNKAFQDLMKSCMDKARSRLDLPSLLIQPVQRMPRYQLLLKELIKLSEKDHVDIMNLEEAMRKITDVNMTINKRKKETDNRIKIDGIQREITGLDSDLHVQGRLFIRSGVAWFTSPKAKNAFYARVYLFNDIVLVAKMAKKDSPPPGELFEKLDMAKIEVQDYDKKTVKLFDGSTAVKLEWLMELDSEDSKKAWMKDIRESLETFQLRSLLDDNIQKTNLIKEGLLILSATYGVLSDPKRCIDVTQALQSAVQQQGGTALTLPAGSKASLPGFINPAKGKSKQLIIVYSAKGAVRTKTWGEKEEIKLNVNVP